MALIPKLVFCVQNSCTELIVRETTGSYDAETNVGGYGTPNPDTITALVYTLTVIAPDGTSYTINLLTEGFPTEDSSFEYSIPLSQLGNRTVIEDGFWQFIWTISGEVLADPENIPYEYSGNTAYYFTCNSECCVAALLAKINFIDSCSCTTTNQKVENYIKAKVLLIGLQDAAFCGKSTLFNSIKENLDKICLKKDCKTCN